MKRHFILLAMLACWCGMVAQESVTAGDVSVPHGGQANLEVGMLFEADHDYVSYQFTVELPEGLSLVEGEYGKADYQLADNQPTALFTVDFPASNGIFKAYSNPSTPIAGNEGTLVSIPIVADERLAIGTTLKGKLSGIVFTHIDARSEHFANVEFNIEVVENITILDENSTTPPTAAEGVKVLVRRTVKAGEWSTLCLPFAMTDSQCKDVFGSDVEIADFTGTEPEFDDDENCVGIKVNFENVTDIEANHPYIIKVSEPVMEFTLDGVDIVADEDEAYIEFDNGRTGSRRVVYSGFYGTYRAQTVVPEYSLFLNDNKFWYSMGQTRMKAFRAYFDFLDVLTEVEGGAAGARITMTVDGETTSVSQIVKGKPVSGRYYDLQGRRVQHPEKKGVYIRNGKKEVVR